MSLYKQNQDQYYFLFLKLKEYLKKESSLNQIIDQSNLEELFCTFKNVYTKKQQELIQMNNNYQYNRTVMNLSHQKCHFEQLENDQSNLRNQRERINQIIIKKESELNCIEKRIKEIKLPIQQNQQFDELMEGIAMCKEKSDYLEEENLEFKKLLVHEKKKNCELKQHYQLIRDKFDNNLTILQSLEKYGLEVNQKMLKQLKIINNLRQFIKKEQSDTFQLLTPRKNKNNDGFICAFSSLENTQFLEDSFNYFDSLKISANTSQNLARTENYLIESLSTIISLKNSLAQINSKEISQSEKSFNPDEESDKDSSDQILVSSNLRFKTHQNLGESQIRKRQISNAMENNRAFSELDEVEEDQDSDRRAVLITDGMYIEDEMTSRQPWFYKSAVQQQLSNKTEQMNWEYGSERKKYTSKPSVASFNSQSSCLKGCTMTLREDFLLTQHSQLVAEDDEAKEKDTDMNNSYEIPQLIQQEQIISDQTILIDRKHQVFNNQKQQNKSSIMKMVGLTVCSVAVIGWGINKLFKKYS